MVNEMHKPMRQRSKFIQFLFLKGIPNGTDLADTAIRALEGGQLTTAGNPSKSTLIIHSVQRVSNILFIS